MIEMLFSLKKNQPTDFSQCRDNYSTNGKETGEATLYTFVSSSLNRRMCKDLSSMSEDRIISIGFFQDHREKKS